MSSGREVQISYQKNTLVRSSVIRCQDHFFKIWPQCKYKNLLTSIKLSPEYGKKFCQILNKPSKFARQFYFFAKAVKFRQIWSPCVSRCKWRKRCMCKWLSKPLSLSCEQMPKNCQKYLLNNAAKVPIKIFLLWFRYLLYHFRLPYLGTYPFSPQWWFKKHLGQIISTFVLLQISHRKPKN